MIVHSWGQRVGPSIDGELRIDDSEASMVVHAAGVTLTAPVGYFVAGIGANDFWATRSYGDRTIRIFSQGNEWSVQGRVFGVRKDYVLLKVELDTSGSRYVAFSPSGEELFQLKDRPREWFCAESLVIGGWDNVWRIFSLDGELLFSIPGMVNDELSPAGLFCEGAAFFQSVSSRGEYQVFDFQKGLLCSLVRFDGLQAVLQLPDQRILAVDRSGWSFLSLEGGSVQVEKRHLFDFDLPPVVVVVWQDSQRAYISFETPWGEGKQRIISISLEDGTQLEQIIWEGEWSVSAHGGFCNGYNHLLLNRRKLMGNGGVLVWKPEEALDPALLKEALSADRVVSEMPSQTKGKHGFHIKINDPSVNNAVRSAASEICRLIGESCSGAYNQGEAVIDRKFDGHFFVEITSTQQPNDFERGYLPRIVEYHRYQGGLSPAGSRLTLQPPEIVWHVTAS